MLTKVLRVPNHSGLDASVTRTGKLVTLLRGLALALLAVVLFATGCGSNEEKAQPSATDVEQSVKDQLSTEGEGASSISACHPSSCAARRTQTDRTAGA